MWSQGGLAHSPTVSVSAMPFVDGFIQSEVHNPHLDLFVLISLGKHKASHGSLNGPGKILASCVMCLRAGLLLSL